MPNGQSRNKPIPRDKNGRSEGDKEKDEVRRPFDTTDQPLHKSYYGYDEEKMNGDDARKADASQQMGEFTNWSEKDKIAHND
jgi:hypothetical protein